MSDSGNGREDRRKRAAASERRDYTPPGRLRRIVFNHKAAVGAFVAAVTPIYSEARREYGRALLSLVDL